MRLRFSKEGLTLVELLVVIGIIAVLAGILWVVFSSVREKARQAGCKNNLHQIWLALQQYRHDYDGLDPDGTPREYWELGLPPHPWALKPYVKSSLHCPLAPAKGLFFSGYMWAVWKGRALGDSGPDWSEAIAKRGENFPISADCNHNPRGCKEFPKMFVIILRLNGKVETKWVEVLGTGSHEW